MIDFKISYHNVDLDIIQKNLNDNKKKVVEINQILADLISLTISNKTTDLNEIKNVANKLTENKDTFVVFGIGGSNLGARALINILLGQHEKKYFLLIILIQFNLVIQF